jgi:hypothetical protein
LPQKGNSQLIKRTFQGTSTYHFLLLFLFLRLRGTVGFALQSIQRADKVLGPKISKPQKLKQNVPIFKPRGTQAQACIGKQTYAGNTGKACKAQAGGQADTGR